MNGQAKMLAAFFFPKCRTQVFVNIKLILQSIILRLIIVIKRDLEVDL